MVTVEIEEKVFEFYRRIVFGSSYNKSNKDKQNIENWCFNAAWSDMARHTLKWKNKLTDSEKREIRDKSINTRIFKEIYKKWEKKELKTVEFISEFQNKVKELKIFEGFSFGQAQKVVNMFFKYLYTFKDDLKITENYFDNCDCPIDRITLTRLYNEETYKGKKWSSLDDKSYSAIQNDVTTAAKKEGYKNRLDFEFGWK